MITSKTKTYSLVSISIAAFTAMLFAKPIAQDVNYHLFVDDRSFYEIPNFWNVVTNFPFIIISVIGVFHVKNSRPTNGSRELNFSCLIFFIGIFLTGIGSAYYHWHPTNQTLVWDRLPMTISFMAFFSLLIGDMISPKAGKQILVPLLFIGIMSIIYWVMTEYKGHGDLRLYALVQFLPILLTPLILLLYKSRSGISNYFWLMVLCYGLAKFFEAYDHQTFFALGISGHSIKHLFAALAPVCLLFGLKKALN